MSASTFQDSNCSLMLDLTSATHRIDQIANPRIPGPVEPADRPIPSTCLHRTPAFIPKYPNLGNASIVAN